MLLHGSSSECDDQSILPPRSSAFTGCASQSQSASPSRHCLQCSYLDVFHPYRRHDIKTTAAVFCLSPSRSRPTARSTLYSRQTGVLSCRRQHVERPSVPQPHHICTLTRGLQTTSQDFPLLSFLPRHSHLTYLSLFIIIVVFLFF